MGFTKEMWREEWLKSIYELTSLEYQKKMWLDMNNTNPHYSFVEFMCYYFDDLLVDIDYKEYVAMGWVSEMEYETIKEWHLKLDKYSSPENMDTDVISILKDPDWLEIVAFGEIARNKLIDIVNSEEKKILLYPKA